MIIVSKLNCRKTEYRLSTSQSEPLMSTEVESPKPYPVIVRICPPLVEPEVGEIEVMLALLVTVTGSPAAASPGMCTKQVVSDTE